MNLLLELLQLNEDLKQIKDGIVCIQCTTLERSDIHRVWAFRTYEMAQKYMDELQSTMSTPERLKYSFYTAQCHVEMGGLMKPGIAALIKKLVNKKMTFIGVGKNQEEILEDAEDYFKEKDFDEHDINWLGYVELDDKLFNW